MIYNLGYGTGVTDISSDGSLAVGSYGRQNPIFVWTAKNGTQPMSGVMASDANVFLSRNGQYMATNFVDQNNTDLGAFRWDSKNGWKPVGSVGSCQTDKTYTWGVTND